jgi:hypothetical protein
MAPRGRRRERLLASLTAAPCLHGVPLDIHAACLRGAFIEVVNRD